MQMGNLMTRLFAEVVLQRLERAVFAFFSPKCTKRCVYDTSVMIKEDNPSAFNQLLNTTLPRITFTMESVAENKPTSLDVLVHELLSGTFETSLYRKATNAGIVPHWGSNYSTSRKRSCESFI